MVLCCALRARKLRYYQYAVNLLRFTAAGVICQHNLTHKEPSVFNEKKHIILRKMQITLHFTNYFIHPFLCIHSMVYEIPLRNKIKKRCFTDVASRQAQACTIPRMLSIDRSSHACVPRYISQWCQTVNLFIRFNCATPAINSRILLFLLCKVMHTTIVYDFN